MGKIYSYISIMYISIVKMMSARARKIGQDVIGCKVLALNVANQGLIPHIIPKPH